MSRTRGSVRAGVPFFPPSRFRAQEPRGDQGQGLVVMPTHPMAHLVVAQPRVALAPLEALLDLVLGLGHPRELRHTRPLRGEREVVVVFETLVASALASYE